MKKLASLLLALVMIMSCFSAMAATVENTTGHTYVAYQIFTGSQGTQSDNTAALGDIAWGNGINIDAFLTALKADSRFNVTITETPEGSETPVEKVVNIFDGCTTAIMVADALSKYGDNSDIAKAFADVAADHRSTTSFEVPANGSETELPKGYYLIIDASELDQGDAYNAALLQVEEDGNFTIAKKYDVPQVDKAVDQNDVNIGDTVTFTLTAEMPDTFEGYKTYKVVFHDNLSKGLTFKNDIVVKVGDEVVTDKFTTAYTANEDGTTYITITCNNILDFVDADDRIVVTYTATLNENAVIGGKGNPNSVYLEYSSNPNWTGDGIDNDNDGETDEPGEDDEPTNTTPEDVVLVFTFELDVTKKDGETGAVLKDAKFKLYREVAAAAGEGEDNTTGETNGTTTKEYVVVDESNKVKNWTANVDDASVLTSDEKGLFSVIGLDAGTYYLEEIQAPAGYNLLTAPIKLVITADYTEETGSWLTDDVTSLTVLTIVIDDGESTTGNLDDGSVAMTVNNMVGATLPETGGMGTTILYVGGGILVLAAIVLLIVKRRANAD